MTALDHVVINALRATDAAAALFSDLGFQLTPRGYHSLGSVNHLMMTPGAYLEIVGVPDTGRQRQEVLDSPLGLSGIVLKTDDAEATHARLAQAGFDPQPVLDFSRPVTLDGAEHLARFRTVRLPGGFYGGGRVYFCQHLTPELVWRPEYLIHANGFAAIDRIEIESPDPEATARRFAQVCAAEYLPAQGVAPDTVRLADAEIAVRRGVGDAMVATGLRFTDLQALADRATQAGIEVRAADDGTLALHLPAHDTVLTCRGAA